MISKKVVEEQLKRIGFNFRLWGRAEVNELGRILLDDETIAEAVNGEYSNGFALLVVTNHRVLLVDKKPMLYLTVEDLRFDMITEFNFSHRLMNATLNLYTPNKTLNFTSWNQSRLRKLLEYTQQRVLEMRQQSHVSQQFQTAAAAQYAQLHAANSYYQPPAPAYEPNIAQQQPAQPQLQAQAQIEPVAPAAPQYEAVPAAITTASNVYEALIPSSPIPVAAPIATPQPELAIAQPSVLTHDSSSDQSGVLAAMIAAAERTPTVAPAPVAQVLVEATSQPEHLMSRLAAKRTALGTYTRSKLPALRRHHDQPETTNASLAQVGEDYHPMPAQSASNFGSIPYEALGD